MITHTKISLTDSIAQCPGHIVSDMDGEKVMLSVQNGKYYNLGEVGGDIWDSLANPIFVAQLIDQLTLQYEIEQALCEQQVIPFLEHLWGEGLISITKE